ncbi:hypothetical protein ACET3Z_026019 [Daucus carota]
MTSQPSTQHHLVNFYPDDRDSPRSSSSPTIKSCWCRISTRIFDMAIVHVLEFLVFVSCFMSRSGVAALENNECSVTKCHRGSEIRFPFHMNYWDKDKQLQSNHCGSPAAFELSCNVSAYKTYDPYSYYPVVKFEYQVSTSLPGLYLTLSVTAYVDSIDYKSQKLRFTTKSTELKQHSDYYLSDSPYKPFMSREQGDYTLYKCPVTTGSEDLTNLVRLDGLQVFAINSYFRTTEALLTSCTKLYNVSHVPFYGGELSWSEPGCGDCEARGQYCKFRPNSTTLTQCFPAPKGPWSNALLVTGKVGGIFGLLLLLVAFCYALHLYKQKKNYQQRIELFLEDYKALKPTRYSPSMKLVIQMLQGEDCPTMPPNPFSSTSSKDVNAAAPSRVFTKELEDISESE